MMQPWPSDPDWAGKRGTSKLQMVYAQSPAGFGYGQEDDAGWGAGSTGFLGGGSVLEPGNIDLNNRPPVRNPDGSVSTVRSISIDDDDGSTVLIPTVVGGRVVPNEHAINHYMQTGEHLGKFANSDAADAFAQQLHESEARRVGLGAGEEWPTEVPQYQQQGLPPPVPQNLLQRIQNAPQVQNLGQHVNDFWNHPDDQPMGERVLQDVQNIGWEIPTTAWRAGQDISTILTPGSQANSYAETPMGQTPVMGGLSQYAPDILSQGKGAVDLARAVPKIPGAIGRLGETLANPRSPLGQIARGPMGMVMGAAGGGPGRGVPQAADAVIRSRLGELFGKIQNGSVTDAELQEYRNLDNQARGLGQTPTATPEVPTQTADEAWRAALKANNGDPFAPGMNELYKAKLAEDPPSRVTVGGTQSADQVRAQLQATKDLDAAAASPLTRRAQVQAIQEAQQAASQMPLEQALQASTDLANQGVHIPPVQSVDEAQAVTEALTPKAPTPRRPRVVPPEQVAQAMATPEGQAQVVQHAAEALPAMTPEVAQANLNTIRTVDPTAFKKQGVKGLVVQAAMATKASQPGKAMAALEAQAVAAWSSPRTTKCTRLASNCSVIRA